MRVIDSAAIRPPERDRHYRPDIDGLRAVAVLSVVAFHAFPDRVPGGFVGVDVFFVISGYLITGIIVPSLQRGTFTLAEFYSRRIRRIFPSLIVVLTATWALGWLVLPPIEYSQLGQHILNVDGSNDLGERIVREHPELASAP